VPQYDGSLVDPYACGTFEIGPLASAGRTVVQFGGNTGCTGDADPTGIYDSSTNTWSAGPMCQRCADPNGTTLCTLADSPAAVLRTATSCLRRAVMSAVMSKIPTHFFEFTTSNAINQVADAPTEIRGTRLATLSIFLSCPMARF